ncbi:hypothetical protein [Paraburkholderia humisilvae]|uniref:hypothetical protein n=1 Tax=Paraburkholderia humisilvae TaxID=627669 RepID=UPI001581AEDB|nr:hypothetical protein [Paraburkholderia humisilvae]
MDAIGTSCTIPRALAWLQHHYDQAVRNAISGALFDDLNKDEIEAYEHLDEKTLDRIYANVYEWLIAEGEIQVDGIIRRVSDLLFEADRPALNDAQRAWLGRLCATPLRLYKVVNVACGRRMTLRDALNASSHLITLHDTQAVVPGTVIGLRIKYENGSSDLVGTAYRFSQEHAGYLLDWISDVVELDTQPPSVEKLSFMIRRAWIAQFLKAHD